jgi:RNA polymerase sigma factor (TIGR02999 family)
MVEEKNKSGNVTELLVRFGRGDHDSYNRLFPLVYDQLSRLAQYQVSRWHNTDRLRRTELINEAYLKLIDQTQTEWKDRSHFYAIAAKAMRHILVDYHRKRKAQKRGGLNEIVPLDEEEATVDVYSEHLETLQGLMKQLAEVNERMHTVVDLSFFAGFTIKEIADLLNVSTSTVDRELKAARAWLYRELMQNG